LCASPFHLYFDVIMTTEYRPACAQGGLEPPPVFRLRRMAALGSAGAAIVALAGLLGYIPRLRIVADIRSNYIPMALSTAGCFFILGMSLFRNARRNRQGFVNIAAVALVFLVTMFSLLEVAGNLSGMDLNFEDRLLSAANAGREFPFRGMSPLTGLTFLLTGFGIFLLLLRSRGSRLTQGLGHCASSLGALTMLTGAAMLLSYLRGIPLMFGGTTVPMAPSTSIAFLFLGAAMVATGGHESFPLRLVFGDSTSARLSRVFLPLSGGIVLLQSILSRFVPVSTMVNDALLLAAQVIVVGTITAAVVARVAHSIGNNIDEINRKLRQSEERHRAIVQTAMDGFWLVDVEGRLLEVNETYCRMSGYGVEELLTMRIPDLESIEADEDTAGHIQKVMAQGEDRFESRHRRKDGRIFDVEVSVQYRPVAEGGRLVVFLREITERKQREQAYMRLVAMLDATPGFVGYADARDSHILYINPSGRKMVGVPEQEDVTRLTIADVHPEWANRLFREEILPTAIREGMWTGECAFLNRDGREISVMMALLSHKSPSGEVERFSTISMDITERKRADDQRRRSLEEKEVLLREVHHRVKNNLNIISSLLNLQSSVIHTPEQAMAAFQNSRDRIMAMALVHEELYRSQDYARVDMGEYLEKLTRQILQAHNSRGDIRVSAEAAGIVLSVSTSIPCGLILNELITNAFKHAFPKGGPGEIRIRFRAADDGYLELSVADNGVGLSEKHEGQSRGSLGLTLVRLLAKQLDGSMEISSDNGTYCRIRFPPEIDS
jgi:PAS domain S-box-containing protein